MSDRNQFRAALALVLACVLFAGWVAHDTAECAGNQACVEALTR